MALTNYIMHSVIVMFRFGPLEWLWRSLTYMKRQPMRIRAQAPEPAPAPAIL